LNARDYKLMLKQIKQTGFNVIRIPFSMQTLKKGKEVSSVADYIGSNKLLKDKSPIEVLDALNCGSQCPRHNDYLGQPLTS